MAGGILGQGNETALFEIDNDVYVVAVVDGNVTEIHCTYQSPSAVLHSYWLQGTKIMGDSFMDDHGLSRPYEVAGKDAPEIVKELLFGKREDVLRRIQNLDSKYRKRPINS